MERDELCGRTLGEFVLRERIGEGGFGAVYRAEQPLLGREAVVKVLHRELRASDNALQRFLREAKLASRLDHPYAAHVYAFGVEKADGLLWIAMELVRGTPLDTWLRERGPLTIDQLVPFFERIAEVVHTAHERGIVHRDLKPSNVMVIERAGRLLPKLLDFGIARLVDGAPELDDSPIATPPVPETLTVDHRPRRPDVTCSLDDPIRQGWARSTRAAAAGDTPHVDAAVPLLARLTQAGAAVGSPPYMAPEQWLDAWRAGPAADLYSLAIVAYEALAGRRPFVATTAQAYMALHLEAEVPAIGDGVPAALDAVFARALAKRAGDRPATALQLAAALRIACGRGDAQVGLPQLAAGVRDAWLLDGPQPLAEAIAALDGARNAHQARDAAWDLARGVVRYLLVIALAARSQVRPDDDPATLALLRALHGRELADEERLALLRLLVRPFADRRGAHPMPALVDRLVRTAGERDSLDHLLELRTPSDGAGLSEDHVRAHLAQLVPVVSELLRSVAFVLDYPLLVTRAGVVERWLGLRRPRRALAMLQDRPPEERQPVLADRDGKIVVILWPLAQVASPSLGADDELFLFDGRGRHGARLLATPVGHEHHDGTLWEWFGQRVVGGAATTPTDDERPPYLGLSTFTSADADRFVGREREIDAFVNRLRTQWLQILVGASGAGKSSFVFAGVVPALPAGWRVVTVRPGATPVATLAAKLAVEPATTTVVVVDQLEELFTICQDDSERGQFAAMLARLSASADGQTRVVCTVRDDFLMRVEALAPLRARLANALTLIGNPSREDLVRTVVEPARRAGYELDPELAVEIADAVAERPGALALLSFTAARLWELRDRRFHRLTRNAYEAMGAVGGALGKHAEATLESLTTDDQRLAREAFRHLVTAEGTRAVLSPAELQQVLASPRAGSVIEKLVAARLVVVGEGEGDARVELAHEALIGAWPRLQQWIREDAAGAQLRDQLRAAARQWNERGRPRGLLWRDEALTECQLWRSRHPDGLTDTDDAFVSASVAEAARGRRRRRMVLGATAVALVAITVIVLLANRRIAVERSRAVEMLRAQYVDQGRQALLAGKSTHALLFLTEARRMGATGPALDVLTARATRRIEAELRTFRGHTLQLLSATFSSDGARVLTASEDGTAAAWDAATGHRLAVFACGSVVWSARFDRDGRRVVTACSERVGNTGRVAVWDARGGELGELSHGEITDLAMFTPDGTAVIAGARSGVVRIWNAATGTLERELGAPGAEVSAIDVSADGHVIAIGGVDGLLRVWGRDGSQIADLAAHRDRITDVQFSPDGARVATASRDRTAAVFEVRTGRKLATLTAHADSVLGVVFSPDGTRVLTAGKDNTAKLWQLEGGVVAASFAGHVGLVNDAQFDAAGARVATASADGSVRLWSVDGSLLAVLEGHGSAIKSVRFSPDGTQVLTASLDGTAKLWRADATEARARLAHADRVDSVAFAPAGDRVVSASRDGKVRVSSVGDGRTVLALQTPRGPHTWARFSPDGAAIISGGNDHAVRVWSSHDGRELAVLGGHGSPVALAHYSGDGALLVTSAEAGVIKTWRWPGGAAGRTLACTEGTIGAIAPSPDGTTLAVGCGDVTQLWSLVDGRRIATLAGHSSGVRAVSFAPDGRYLVTGGGNRDVVVWDTRGARIATLAKHGGAVLSVRFSRDGSLLVTASEDTTANVWRTRDWSLAATLEGHADVLLDAEASPDGALIATAGLDRTAKLWDAATGRLLQSFEGHRGFVLRVVFGPDGKTVATASWDGTVGLWDVHGDRRTAAELDAVARCLVPFALVDGRPEARPIDASCGAR